MVRMKLNPNDVDAIFITHMHPDHASGLFTILQFMNLNGRTNALSLFVPRGVFPGISAVLPYFQIFENQWPFSILFQPLDGGAKVSIGDFSLLPVANAHLEGHRSVARRHSLGCDSYSFVFNDRLSGSVLYTSDIPDFTHLENLREGTGLLISEITHVSLPSVIDFCRRHRIAKLVLTHLSTDPSSVFHPSTDDGASIQCQWAMDGTVLEV